MDHLCYLCLVFVMLSRLFIDALWSPEGKYLTSWLMCVMFIVILFLSRLVSWDRCGTWLYRFLILAAFLIVVGKLVPIVRGDRDSRANLMPIYGDLYQIKL